MKESQQDQSRSIKREPEEERRKGTPGFELPQLIDALRQQFEQDRALASQSSSARCGICYLYYRQTDLFYREEEGFYVCKNCQRTLGNTKLKMLRRQQHS